MSEVIRRNSIFRSLEVGDSPGPHPRASHFQRNWKMNTGSWPKTVDIASNCKQLHPGSASAYPRMVERDTGHNFTPYKKASRQHGFFPYVHSSFFLSHYPQNQGCFSIIPEEGLFISASPRPVVLDFFRLAMTRGFLVDYWIMTIFSKLLDTPIPLSKAR